MKIKDNIFRQYDIRGIYGKDLDDSTAYLLGKAFGTYCITRGEKNIVVGYDNRLSSPSLKFSLVNGLISTGCIVTDCTTITTPMLYFARYFFNTMAGVMVTASHNPANYNGFKLCGPFGDFLCGDQIQEILKIIKTGAFVQGAGYIKIKNITSQYYEMLLNKVHLGPKQLKVVVDCGNGTASLFAEEYFTRLGVDFIPLFCESDPTFPNHETDTLKLDNLRFLVAKVKETHADIGIAFDGDADRCAVVDENGNIVFSDKLLVLFWKEIFPKFPNAPVLVDVKSSLALIDELKKLGAKNIQFCKTGHSLIKAKMKEIGAVFAGELSGHIFFGDEFYGHDDGFYVASRLLRILSNTDETLSHLLENINVYNSTPEIQLDTTDTEKYSIVAKATEYFKNKDMNLITVDGVRAIYEYGWGLVRASNTSPKVTIRCEADTIPHLNKIKNDLENAIGRQIQ